MLAKEIIRRVREVQVRTGRQVADVLAGEYVSVFKGRGMEFDEVRPYVPGDDVRTIDWNVTARAGAPFVKRYVEERQLTLMLMADISASQDFGSGHRSKREATAEFCALLAFSATRNDDKVGLTLFHGGIEQYIPPRKGQKHALRVVREVLAHGLDTPAAPRARSKRSVRSARESTDIGAAVEFFLSVSPRKAVTFVVSDWLDDTGWLKAMQTANRKHDVIAVLVTDPRELELPDVGLVTLADPESGRSRLVDTGGRAFRDAFRAQAARRVEEVREAFKSSGIDFIHIDASRSVVDPLVKFFRMRERKRQR